MTMVALPVLDPVYTEWEQFLQTGNLSKCKARQQIAESWGRSYYAGVDPYDDKIYYGLDDVSLHTALCEKKEFIDITRLLLVKFDDFFKDAGYIVALADEKGNILEMHCDEAWRRHPLVRYFHPGVSWWEEKVGTNAIGTALKLREPLQVAGAEHFCKTKHSLICSAALIYGSNGRVVGVLTVSSITHVSHEYPLKVAEVIADAVTAQLCNLHNKRKLMLVNKRMTNFLNTVSDGVIIVDNNELVTEINPAARRILGKAEQQASGLELSQLFDSKAAAILTSGSYYHDVKLMIEGQGEEWHCVASREPIINELDLTTGSIIFLRCIKHKKHVANRSGSNSAFNFCDIIGKSAQIREVIYIASRAASTTSNILLNGESGTGKEIFAQAIHNANRMRTGPFVAVNCGAIPRELIGSELFGYEEGAFTGAKRGGKPGKFELASGGTLFLDEIGDMPIEQQISLLRVIQERKVSRIGSEKTIPIDIRLICATHKSLLDEIRKGKFRLDLYYRLNVLSISIPTLRERNEDIRLLTEHFLEKISREHARKYSLDPEVFSFLASYHWPGNVRELQNVIEHAVCIAENGYITVEHLSEKLQVASTLTEPALPQADEIIFGREQRQKIAAITEKNEIINKLNTLAGNVTRVAKALGMSRTTLYNKMKMYAIKN